MIGVISIAEHCIARDLQGARMLGCIEDGNPMRSRSEGEQYIEWTVYVAWENDKECGTHRVQVNTKEESMAVSGHYFTTRDEAIIDMLKRAAVVEQDYRA